MGENKEKIISGLIQKAFTAYDFDGSGYLERPEVRKLIDDSCREVGIQLVSDQHLDKIIDATDADKDGRISLQEFSVLIRPTIEKQLDMN